MRKTILATPTTLLVAALSAAGGYGLHSGGAELVTPAAAQAQETPGSRATGQATGGRENTVVTGARAWGITTCSRQIASMSDYLTAGTVFAANATSDRRNPDRAIFSTALATRSRANGAISWSNMTVVPVSGGCNSAYETVAYFKGTCTAVRNAQFADFGTRVEFGDAVELYVNKGGAALYLMPAGEGCVTIRNQIIY